MGSNLNNKRILLIDRQNGWRKRSADGLRAVGACVVERGTYDYPSADGRFLDSEKFDLVILGCPSIRAEEQQLIDRILEHGDHLLVLSTLLPSLMMRLIFLAGVDDATDKPYDPVKLVKVVTQSLEAIKPRDSYQAVAHEVL